MSRLKYWREQARQAQADFDRLMVETADQDLQLEALTRFIAANRQLDAAAEGQRFSWIFNA